VWRRQRKRHQRKQQRQQHRKLAASAITSTRGGMARWRQHARGIGQRNDGENNSE
jgi:hypothetical protein